MNYFKKIDSIRAIAVLMVVVSHWIPKTARVIPIGGIGVNIFFVISGFLITRILLSEKEKAREIDKGNGQVLRNFFLRRILRIFPIYYLSIFIFWLLKDYEGFNLESDMVYFLTFTSNILFYVRDEWYGYMSPLWSLAVEEQFYLMWPFVILFSSTKFLSRIILGSIMVAVIFKFFFWKEMAGVLTPACLSSLGAGALLAWLNVFQVNWLIENKRGIFYVGLASLFLLIIGYLFNLNPIVSQSRLLVSIISFVWIMYSIGVYQPINLLDSIMINPALLFIGRISYGIYLYHSISPILWGDIISPHLSFLFDALGKSYANMLLMPFKFGLLLLVSWASYRFIEMPFLNLKKYFTLKYNQSVRTE